MSSRRTFLVILAGVFLLDGCTRAVHAVQESAVCSESPDRPADEPLFQRARELLTDPAFATSRAEYGLTGDPQAAEWVTDDATCAHLAGAVAGGRRVNTTMPVAAVRLGNFYLVRTDPLGPPWLLSDRFKVLTLFIVPS